MRRQVLRRDTAQLWDEMSKGDSRKVDKPSDQEVLKLGAVPLVLITHQVVGVR